MTSKIANQVRVLRAQLKRDLKARRASIGALLRDPPPYLETAKVFKVVLGLPGYGSVKATEILHRCRVSPSKTFGGLSERQRYELAERLDRSPSRAFQEASDTSPSADTSSACALAIAHDFSYLAPPGRTTHARHVPRWTCRRGTGRS